MKLKQSPDDFFVEECTDVRPGSAGEFALYRLDKRGWTTPDAVQALRRRWQLDGRQLSYGGLKDRHAHTVQFISVLRGPATDFHQPGVAVTYLGQVPSAYTSADIRANRFRVVLRELSPGERAFAEPAFAEAARAGVPNYFDDQRFGSVSGGVGFAARAMVLGNFEEALRLALTAPYEFDHAPQKKEKAILRAHWGDWRAVKRRLGRGHAQMLADYLCAYPGDYRGAVCRLRPELRGLYLSAYQSHLWNRMLALWLERHLPADRRTSVRLRLGDVPFHRELTPELERLQLPLPSARLPFDPAAEWAPLVTEVLSGEGFGLADMKIKGMRQPFFSRGDRAGLSRIEGLTHAFQPDDRHPGKEKL
jgi:tRNA pseudouridine13 synthase